MGKEPQPDQLPDQSEPEYNDFEEEFVGRDGFEEEEYTETEEEQEEEEHDEPEEEAEEAEEELPKVDEEEELKPKEFKIKRDTTLTFENVEDLTNMVTKVKLVWPENLKGYHEEDFATDPSRHGYPRTYYVCSPKEKAILWHAENYRRQFIFNYPERRPLYIAPKNQCGVQRLFPTYICPTTTRYRSFYHGESCVQFLKDFFNPDFIEPVTDLPKCIRSHDALIKDRKANAFEFSIFIVSLLIGAGWNAFVVDGYASKEFTTLCATVNYKDDFAEPFDYFGDEKIKEFQKTSVKSSTQSLDKDEEREEPIRPISPSKYKVRFKKEFKSKYEKTMELREEARLQEEAAAAEKLANEEYLRNLPPPTPDKMLGYRTHSWVLILPRKGDPSVETPYFLEPFTGTKREITDPGFTGIESVFNNTNFWANLQPCYAGCGELSYDLTDGSKWGQFLFEPASIQERKLKKLKKEQSKAEVNHEDEEEEDEKRVHDIYLDMPVSWTKDLEINESDYELKYPSGKKTFQFNDAIVEVSSPYVNADGLIRKVLKFNGKSRKTKNLIYIEERFMHRSDKLIMRKWFRKGRMLHEYFAKGRPDALKEHVHVSGKNKSYYPRHLYYYSNAHIENVYHRQVVHKGLVEHFEDREDFLYHRFTAFGDVLCDTIPAKEAKSRTKVFMEFVRGETRRKRARRKIIGIIEKFGRNPAKEIGEDISEKYILIDEGRFRIAFHYGNEEYTRATLEFFKTAKGFQKEAVDFKPEDSIEFRVDPFTPVLTNYKKYQFLKQLKKDQMISSDMVRAAEDDIFNSVNDRVQEDWRHQMNRDVKQNEFEDDETAAARAAAQAPKEVADIVLDFAAPYIEMGAPRNREEETQLKKRIMEDAKERTAKRIEHIKTSYAAESAKLKDLLNHRNDMHEDLEAQEHGMPSAYEQTLTRMHIMEQRLIRLREKAPGDYCSLLIQVIQHPLLNRYAEQDRAAKQLEIRKGLEQLEESKKPVPRRSCCTVNYFYKHKEKKKSTTAVVGGTTPSPNLPTTAAATEPRPHS